MNKKHRFGFYVPVFLILLIALPFVVSGFLVNRMSSRPSEASGGISNTRDLSVPSGQRPDSSRDDTKVPLPTEVRGIYWTSSTAHSKRADQLLSYMKSTGLNTVVIDLKTDAGKVVMTDPTVLEKLAEENIYRIARLSVMRDGAYAREHPEFALKSATGDFWYDNIGSVWVDPAAEQVWENAIVLAKEAYANGFDEIQFDYVRFPSDGAVSSIKYPVYNFSKSKAEVMEKFFEFVGGEMMQEGIPVSFDLFGMTFWTFEDFRIGQRLIDVLPNADFISPMVYPSHYPDWFEGYGNPAEYPYEIVKRSLDEGTKLMRGFFSGSEKELRNKFRPWIQDFDIGAVYTSEKIEAQIKACRDAGASGWILWNARNVYEPANYQ